MKKAILLTAAAATLSLMVGVSQVYAQAKLTSDSTIGEILDNPGAKAVFKKHLPEMADNPQIEQARTMTLKSLQQYAPTLTDDKLKEIDADLAKASAPAKK